MFGIPTINFVADQRFELSQPFGPLYIDRGFLGPVLNGLLDLCQG